MAMQSLTPETAPRDAAELLKVGRFLMRDLARKLPLAKDAAKHAEFLRLQDAEMAEELARVLTEMDGPAKKPAAEKAAGKAAGKARQPPAAQEEPTEEKPAGRAPAAATAAAFDPKLAGDIKETLTIARATSKEVEALGEKIDAVYLLLARVAAVQLTIGSQATGASEDQLLEVAKEDAKRLFDVSEES